MEDLPLKVLHMASGSWETVHCNDIRVFACISCIQTLYYRAPGPRSTVRSPAKGLKENHGTNTLVNTLVNTSEHWCLSVQDLPNANTERRSEGHTAPWAPWVRGPHHRGLMDSMAHQIWLP